MVESRGALAQEGRRAERLELRVPTTPTQLPAVRAMAGDLAMRMDYDLDAVEDLRLAVDEACARLLALPGVPRTIRLMLCSLPGRVEVILTAGGTAIWPPGGLEDSLSWRVLAALTDDLRFELWNGAPAIRFVKRMLGGGR
jgi:serine/threonine-protein kinase RsbW